MRIIFLVAYTSADGLPYAAAFTRIEDAYAYADTRGGEVITTEIDSHLDLIAAAPDMLAALERALFILESPLLDNIPINGAGAVDAIRAAITKAKRNQP